MNYRFTNDVEGRRKVRFSYSWHVPTLPLCQGTHFYMSRQMILANRKKLWIKEEDQKKAIDHMGNITIILMVSLYSLI